MLSTIVATVHLLSLVAGVSVLISRARALQAVQSSKDLGAVLFWDNLAGLIAIVWIGSGLYRAFGGLEKGSDYYLSNHVFWLKMLLLLVVLGVECVPMVTFIIWRIRLQKKESIDLSRKARLVRLHWVELAVMMLMVVPATFMARGVGVVQARSLPATDTKAADVQAGAKLYQLHCSTCHQADGRGLEGRLAADFVGDGTRLAKSDAHLLKSISGGVPGTAMIGFGGRLTDAEMRQTLSYIRASFGAQR